MTDYIKFIDSPAIREHLRTLPPLPPAQQSILIAQSEIRSLDEKLAALREMRATIPPEEFSRGCWEFQSDDSFPVILDRDIQILDVRAKGGLDAGLRRDWGGDLPNGYAYVPHPFKRGDIIRQGDSYYVLDESVEEIDGRFSWGADDSDMVLYGMSWDKASGSFGHEHIYFTKYGTELVAPADLPERQRMLAAVSVVMHDGHALIEFLQCFTNGYRDELEKNAVKWAECEKSSLRSSRAKSLRGDMPTSVVMRNTVLDLPANLFLPCKYHVHPISIRVQRSGAAEPNYRDTVELTLETEPRFLGGTGDLSCEDVQAIRDFVVRNLEPLLAYWNEKMSFDDLLAALR